MFSEPSAPPPGWIFSVDEEPISTTDFVEDNNPLVERLDGAGEPMKLSAAWRIYSRETGKPNLLA